MKEYIIEKPILKHPYKSSFSYTKDDIDRMNRRRDRAKELGIRLLVLDGQETSDKLQELEYKIIDDYIDMDKEVPEDLKKEYLELKKEAEKEKNNRK